MHEIELAGSKHRAAGIESCLHEMDQALASPLLGSLPVFSTAARRMTDLRKQLGEIERHSAAERVAIISVRTREKLSAAMCAALREEKIRAEAEMDLQELISRGIPTSLPQGDAD